MDKKDDIEKLFSKKFEKFEVKSSEEEWIHLSSKLNKSNFLKFSFVTFNIYYLLVLATFAGTATFAGIKNIQLTKKVYRLEQTVQTYQNADQKKPLTDQSVDSAKVLLPLFKPEESKEVTKVEIKPANENRAKSIEPASSPKNRVSTEIPKEIKDTVKAPIININQSDTTIKNKVRKVKKTLVVKPKTVVIKDTVVVTKSFKQK